MNYLVSIIIPAYNEEKTLEEIIRKVYATDIRKEIIVVNEGKKIRLMDGFLAMWTLIKYRFID
jgi:glycosyltransferase involved in cell wall biosynthesis